MEMEHIVGNAHLKEKLLKAVSTRQLSNTLLFCGPDAVGKKLFALSIAKYLLYPDGITPSCEKKLEDHTHPDLHLFFPEGKTGMHTIAAIRELIDQVSFPPYEAKAKVFIIDDAERMLPSSSNALLKTLEEPSLDSYIFLITSHMEEMLPTIVSRSSKWIFHAVFEAEVEFYLKEKMEKPASQATYLAHLSNGSIARAIELANHINTDRKRELLLQILAKENGFSYLDLSALLTSLEQIYEEEASFLEEKNTIVDSSKWHKEVDLLLGQILMWYRDLHLLKSSSDRRYLYYGDHLSSLLAQDLTQIPSLSQVHKLLEETDLALQRNMKLKTALENLFFQL